MTETSSNTQIHTEQTSNYLQVCVGERLNASEILEARRKYIVVASGRRNLAGDLATIALPPAKSYEGREIAVIGGVHAVIVPHGQEELTGDYRSRHAVRLVPLIDDNGSGSWAVV